MQYLLVYKILCGVICALIAAHKGRNAVGWFLGGLFLDLIGIIIVAVVSNLKLERARYEQGVSERRRLREELKLERMRNRQFRGQASARIDLHDRALGVDTRPPATPALGEAGEPLLDAPVPPPLRNVPVWYYATEEGRRVGPLSFEALTEHYRERRLTSGNLVWSQGWPDWRRLGDVDDLARKLEE